MLLKLDMTRGVGRYQKGSATDDVRKCLYINGLERNAESAVVPSACPPHR